LPGLWFKWSTSADCGWIFRVERDFWRVVAGIDARNGLHSLPCLLQPDRPDTSRRKHHQLGGRQGSVPLAAREG